jgi:hypothetical protein
MDIDILQNRVQFLHPQHRARTSPVQNLSQELREAVAGINNKQEITSRSRKQTAKNIPDSWSMRATQIVIVPTYLA